MSKPWAKRFYASKLWKAARRQALMRDEFTCRMCGGFADEVHHKIYLTSRNIFIPEIALEQKNLISLCSDCHKRVHNGGRLRSLGKLPDTREGFVFDEDGVLIRALPPPGLAARRFAGSPKGPPL